MISFFARHPTAANLLMLVLVLLGTLALPRLQRETYPEFEPSFIRVTASYPGAPTELMDSTVVQRVEDEMAKKSLQMLARWERQHEKLFKSMHDRAFEEYASMPWGG